MNVAAFQALFVVPAALALLPPACDTPEARAMLLAIGLQESQFRYRRQMQNGPARSYWQFEVGGVAGVLTHRASQPHAERILTAFNYPLSATALLTAIEHNDILAAALARLNLMTFPEALPLRSEADVAWRQYLQVWRPGAHLHHWRPGDPLPSMVPAWAAHFRQAWDFVHPLPPSIPA